MMIPKVSLFDAFLFGIKSVFDNFRIFFFSALYYALSMILFFVGIVGNVFLMPGVYASLHIEQIVGSQYQAHIQEVINYVSTYPWMPYLSLILIIIGVLMFFAILAGVIQVLVAVYARRDASMVDFFEGTKRTIPLLGLSILNGICVTVGLLFFLLPGIYIFMRLAFSKFILVGEKVSIMTAFKKSWHVTRGQEWNIFGLYTLMILFMRVHTNAGLIFAPILIGSALYLYKKSAETTAY